MSQMDLKGMAVENAKTKISDDKKVSSYNRFFHCAFSSREVEDIIEAGGSESEENFKQISQSTMKNKDYWEKMFEPTFTGKDKRVRVSKFKRLSSQIYSNYFKDLKPEVKLVSYERFGKEFKIGLVPKGKTYFLDGKQRKAGQFLPKKYYGGI